MITLDITTTRIPPIAAQSIAMMRSIPHPPFGVGEGGAEMGAGGDIGVEAVCIQSDGMLETGHGR